MTIKDARVKHNKRPFETYFEERGRRDLQQSDARRREGLQAGDGPGGQCGRALRHPVCPSRGDAPVEPEHPAHHGEPLTNRHGVICETVTYKNTILKVFKNVSFLHILFNIH